MVMPTYNEAANLEWIVGRLREVQPEVDVLVVDDGSPDGTGAIADRLAAADAQVKVVHRAEKQGLGAAYRHGFRVALDDGYDVIGEMDADGSHQPEELHRLLTALARRRPGDRVALDPRRLGGQLAAPARGALARWQPLRAAAARHPRPRRHGRLSGSSAGTRWRRSTSRTRAVHRLRLPDRHGLPHAAGGPPGHRGADRVRRAGAWRLQDVRGGGARVPPADHRLGAARARSSRCGGWAGGCGADERGPPHAQAATAPQARRLGAVRRVRRRPPGRDLRPDPGRSGHRRVVDDRPADRRLDPRLVADPARGPSRLAGPHDGAASPGGCRPASWPTPR